RSGDGERGDPAVVAGVHRRSGRAAGARRADAAGTVRKWDVHNAHRGLIADDPGVLLGVPAARPPAVLQPGYDRYDGGRRAVRRLGVPRRPRGAVHRRRRAGRGLCGAGRPVRGARVRLRGRVRARLGRRGAGLAVRRLCKAVPRMRTVHPIEAESYRRLRATVDTAHLPPHTRDVVERIVHTTADPGWLDDLVTDEAALEAGARALAAGAPLVVDVTMVAAGITGYPSICRLGEPADGLTRSAAAIRRAAGEVGDGAVWVVGNAPTALDEVLRVARRPALVV